MVPSEAKPVLEVSGKFKHSQRPQGPLGHLPSDVQQAAQDGRGSWKSAPPRKLSPAPCAGVGIVLLHGRAS